MDILSSEWLQNAVWAVLLLLLVVAVVMRERRGSAADARWSGAELPYRGVESLLTGEERRFYEALRPAVGVAMHIAPKVRLLDLVWLPRNTENRLFFQNKVIQKHVDFVLCDPASLAPLLVVELDDRSHQREDRQQRDALVDSVLASAGIPILHVPTTRTYSPGAIGELVAGALPRRDGAAATQGENSATSQTRS